MKVKHITHSDYDAVGCAVLAKLAFGENVDTEYCNYDDVNEKVSDFLKPIVLNGAENPYDLILITDISVNDEIAAFINSFIDPKKIQLLDHHKTAEWLNRFPWACVREYISVDLKNCGTTMLYYYLLDNGLCDLRNNDIAVFTEIVRKYDTWEWKTKYNDDTPKKWNDLLYIIGRDKFVDMMVQRLSSGQRIEFTEMDQMILAIEQDRIDGYVESRQKQLFEKDILGYKAGVVFAERYTSEVGNKLAENNPHLDFIVLINPSHSISYRGVKKDIDLGKDIAKAFGGGGHPSAAGSPLPENFKEHVIKLAFDEWW